MMMDTMLRDLTTLCKIWDASLIGGESEEETICKIWDASLIGRESEEEGCRQRRRLTRGEWSRVSGFRVEAGGSGCEDVGC